MILGRIGPDALYFRALVPRWSYQPESGAGAARTGGRFNRPGVEARYLAASAEGALLEYQAESELLPPATIAAYQVNASVVVDFRRGYDAGHWSPIWAEAYCNWKGLWMHDGVEPPSWVIGDLVREAGHPGILYPSARDPGHICLVLFTEHADKFTAPVWDPDGRLPRNAESWP
jgi:RES domain-containing protein